MNRDTAKELIRRLAYRSCIAYSKHCSQRMSQRSVTSDDFLQVLMWGSVNSVKYNPDTGHWKCEVQGDDIDGDELKIQIAIDKESEEIICITVI